MTRKSLLDALDAWHEIETDRPWQSDRAIIRDDLIEAYADQARSLRAVLDALDAWYEASTDARATLQIDGDLIDAYAALKRAQGGAT
jgi:hypothetical protein